MDQSEMLTLISGLYDKLVADVAQRVITKLTSSEDTTLDNAMDEIGRAHV